MTRPTVNRAELRRAIAMEFMMPFALRYSQGFLNPSSASSSQTTIIDTKLTQPNDFWNNSWVYARSSTNVESVSFIKDFGANTLLLETPLGFLPNTSTIYEIHSIFNANEIHQAINRAILESYPAFYDEVENIDIVITEDMLEYDLSGLTNPVELISKVWVEEPYERIYGVVSTVGANSITTSGLDLSNVNNLWKISFYGNLQGQAGKWTSVTSVVGNTINFAPITGLTIQAGAKFLLFNPTKQRYSWHMARVISFDRKEYPRKMYFNAPMDGVLGHRIRLIYTTTPVQLTSDSSVTVVPREYIIARAVSILASSRINDNRVDRQRYAVVAQQKLEEAERFKQRNFFRRSDITLWMEDTQPPPAESRVDGNPLNW